VYVERVGVQRRRCRRVGFSIVCDFYAATPSAATACSTAPGSFKCPSCYCTVCPYVRQKNLRQLRLYFCLRRHVMLLSMWTGGNGFRWANVWILAIFLGTGACGTKPGLLGGCPAKVPAGGPGGSGGAPCSIEGLICSYGDSPSICGKDIAVCRNGRFYVSVLNCIGSATCPPSVPASGATCSFGPSQNPCAYTRGILCSCDPGSWGDGGQGPSTWSCNAPVLDALCPDFLPNLGAACSVEGADCDYGQCQGGWHEHCSNGTWAHVTSDACP
jgi:hypothetical protein